MKDDFLSYYNNELSFLRAAGDEFAKTNPSIAGRLRLNEHGSEDPHIARLIESFAFLTARIHRKIDDDLPELADTILGTLYPHYQLPIPSLSVIQFQANPEATAGHFIPQKMQIESNPSEGATCQFSTCYDVMVHPIEITHLELIEETSAALPFLPTTQCILEISLRCLKSKVSFSMLNPKSIRFFINLTTPYSYIFYDLLFRDGLGGFIVEAGKKPVAFSRDDILAIGFNENFGIIPYPEQSALSYRLLTEFFVFPAKFLFFDIAFKEDFFVANDVGRDIKIILCFKDSAPTLRPILTNNSLALHCTPLVNLFDKEAEPILVDHTQSAYPIIPDARRLTEIEVYKVKSVALSKLSGAFQSCLPLYGFKEKNSRNTYWHTERKHRAPSSSIEQHNREIDVFISFVDSNQEVETSIAQISLLCTNHQLPSQLPHGGGHPKLQLVKENIEGEIRSLLPFTPCYHLPLSNGIRWQLISHLMLNTFTFSKNSDATKFLKEILHLYNFSQMEEHALFINNIASVETKPIVARGSYNYGNTVFSGTEMIVTFVKEHPAIFLFSSVLEKFIASYCSINSFTQLTIQYANKSGEVIQWKPNMGSKVLL